MIPLLEVPITDGLPATNAELERLERRIAPARSRHQPDQCSNLEQFVQHERQEIDTLAELAGALEGHRVAMAELATALALVRHQLFDESPHAQEDL